ncbi:MAG TPA: HEAT repeat domain-containing protein [Gemmatimonadales bacterium]|nr:HEAT repeat domain-containing protein [Gemmatimonadales bacterium]
MLSCLSLLLAVTSAVQVTAAPTPQARAHRRARAATIAPLVAPVAALEAGAQALYLAQPDIDALTAQAPVLAMAASDLQMAAYSLTAAPVAFAAPVFYWDGDEGADVSEPAWPDQTQADVADSLYRAARQALNRSQYARAAELFSSIRDKYPRSTYIPNTYYWQAFALYRDGSEEALRDAREALQTQASRFPKATTRRDADALMRRVQGALARLGDPDATADVTEEADNVAPPTPVIAATPPVGPGPAIIPRPGRTYHLRNESCDDEDDIRIAAVNALLQMDADRAVPILKSILARRDTGSTCLRRKAVFLVSQKRSSETSAILLNAVRSDPDQEVREQAVFWLSQVPGEETVVALDSILRDPRTDPEIQDKAIFALSQHNSSRSASILRAYAERRDAPEEMREKAIFWLGQRNSPENAQFLKDLYARVENDDLKEKIIFSLSQMGGTDNYRWLMDIALNSKEDIEIRKKALFWAGQGHSVDVADLVRLYDSMNGREMKEHLIFVYSQRREEAALDKLFQIGKNDPDRELRKKAIFWIGQSRSPRAAQYLQELINQ